jgi:hypothetical protein
MDKITGKENKGKDRGFDFSGSDGGEPKGSPQDIDVRLTFEKGGKLGSGLAGYYRIA